ncbi:MAG: hypothetical protein HYR67_00510 [Bacteroidetes bacterium]|nr:hypothetical protein [Bacteroidota bacterium]
MKTKLTLTIEEEIVQKAKNHVEKTSESLSFVIEKFLKSLIGKNRKYSAVNASRGLLKKKFSSMSNRDIRKEYYQQKHGV